MKTLEQTLKKWYNPLHGIGDIALIQITEAMKEYADECAKEALRLASESADTIEVDNGYGLIDIVDKQSILSENNLPKHR